MTDPYYQDDHVTLYHGDCLELADLWTVADVLVTDPPYGIGWARNGISNTSTADRAAGNFNGKARSHFSDAGIFNDETPEARDRALAAWGEGPALVFGSFYAPFPPGFRHVAVFVKALDSGAMSALGGIRRDVEPIFMLGQHPDWKRGGRRTSVFQTRARSAGNPSGYAGRAGHPHAKPLDVLEELITEAAPPGVIADPFAGSGSTGVAAKALGRKAILVELEERYAEIAARRLSQDVLNFEEPAP